MFCWFFPAIVLSGSGILVSEDQTRIDWKTGDRFTDFQFWAQGRSN